MNAATTTHYTEITAYRTKDGSEIREFMHPSLHASRAQSLAEATIDPGARTALHRHLRSEELYHVLAGEGRMTLGDASFGIAAGDTVCIPPGTPHCVANAGAVPLRLLCCCSPAYAHDDTELL
jgi:mannose-6-phosphate isomerase-like protein (cupin superfamily)